MSNTTPAESTAELCYSIDEENYRYDCMGDALQALDDDGRLEIGATLYEAEAQHHTASRFFDIDCLFDDMGERASDECGEWADSFPDVTKEKQQELNALIEAWLDANVTVSFYTVTNAREIKVTAEMISEHSAEPAAISFNPLEHEQSK